MNIYTTKNLLQSKLQGYFRLCLPFLFIFSMLYCLVQGFIEQNKEREDLNKMAQIPVRYNSLPKPNCNQKNLELAIALFSIKSSNTIKSISYLSNLPFRGITLGNAFKNNKVIFIGSSAFTSWGVLGSTLAHEAEIHGNQSFFKIELLNFAAYMSASLVNNNLFFKYKFNVTLPISYGTYTAELEAYNYELISKKRFHLSLDEVAAIKKTLVTDVI
ncbi:hypothetical protein [Spirobacillus cienkowskii]|uniref:hypothetical protein n=1 Tax=Spirobacillus cienkowskii TaxID=495820 RepID=UPI0030CCEA6D